jgi:WD40 repeat protein
VTIRIFDVVSREERIKIPVSYFVNAVAFAPDGRTLAWAGSSPRKILPNPTVGDSWRLITLWDVTAGKERATLAGHKDGISSLAFSADGTLIVSGGYDQTVRLWQAVSGKEVATLDGPGAIHGVALSSDGRYIAAATGNRYFSDDERIDNLPGIVMLWDLATRRRVEAPVATHKGSVRTVAFSPDGKILASGGHDGLVNLWDGETGGKQRAMLQGHPYDVFSLAFAPDGKTLASSGLDRTVRLWRVEELLSSRPDQ